MQGSFASANGSLCIKQTGMGGGGKGTICSASTGLGLWCLECNYRNSTARGRRSTAAPRRGRFDGAASSYHSYVRSGRGWQSPKGTMGDLCHTVHGPMAKKATTKAGPVSFLIPFRCLSACSPHSGRPWACSLLGAKKQGSKPLLHPPPPPPPTQLSKSTCPTPSATGTPGGKRCWQWGAVTPLPHLVPTPPPPPPHPGPPFHTSHAPPTPHPTLALLSVDICGATWSWILHAPPA